MLKKPFTLLFAAALACSACAAQAQEPAPQSRQLFDAINQWRAAQGLSPVAYSPSLEEVAQAHVADLEASRPQGACSPHSWRHAPGDGSDCPCYDVNKVARMVAANDYSLAQCMWKKPAEITRGAYWDNGFEIAVQVDAGDDSAYAAMTPEMALQSWLDSKLHHAVLANSGAWSAQPWQAMGVAVSQHYAVAWFGHTPDGVARAQEPVVAQDDTSPMQSPSSNEAPAVQVTIHDASGHTVHTTTRAGN